MLTVDFFHDAVCCWCFNISSRMRVLARELALDVRHRSFVLQASKQEMAHRWGSADKARETILGHWETCRRASDRPEFVNVTAMARAGFDYPHGMPAAIACKAAETMGGQAAHWDLFDRIQLAHLSEARNIADPSTLLQLGADVGLNPDRFLALMQDRKIAALVEADRQLARDRQVSVVPSLVIRETGTRLVNGPLDDLRAQFKAAQRLAA